MSRLARLGKAAGQLQYLRGKGAFWVELIRQWILPAVAVGAYVTYLGFGRRVSVVVACLVPIAVETLGFLIGRFLYDHGGVEADYEMAMKKDPFKVRSLTLFEQILAAIPRRAQ